MSLESNKEDFEKALSEMKEAIELLEYCVEEDIILNLKLVVDEYEVHLQSDIEEAESKIDNLTDQIADNESTIEDLSSEITELQDVIEQLND